MENISVSNMSCKGLTDLTEEEVRANVSELRAQEKLIAEALAIKLPASQSTSPSINLRNDTLQNQPKNKKTIPYMSI